MHELRQRTDFIFLFLLSSNDLFTTTTSKHQIEVSKPSLPSMTFSHQTFVNSKSLLNSKIVKLKRECWTTLMVIDMVNSLGLRC